MNRLSFSVLPILLIGIVMLVSGCLGNSSIPSTTGPSTSVSSTESEGSTPGVAVSDTPDEPNATQEPLAALVNGEAITMAEYEAELARFQAAGTELATIDESDLIDEMITEMLLAQGAGEAGYTVDDTTLQARIDALGLSQDQLAEWMQQNFYTEEQFRQAMRRNIAAGWMRDRIIADVPQAVDQVHARQIRVSALEEAQSIHNSLEAGTPFEDLAAEYEPVTGGEIGWFPLGYLTEPAVEEAAFSLEPGQYSEIIETRLGYHIVYVSERDAQHPLIGDTRLQYQHQALADWLEAQRANSQIEIFLP